ncbi:MAG TPA: hypothetical protein VNL14_01195 [Candidatus Acidoferrales bacterium]|nr:hypothetical protein [Candidatus Acidoferrales bacterium]
MDWRLDATLRGVRCRPLSEVRCYDGIVSGGTEGTILCELEGSTGTLVCVYWDNGINALVDPGKIVISDEEIIWN